MVLCIWTIPFRDVHDIPNSRKKRTSSWHPRKTWWYKATSSQVHRWPPQHWYEGTGDPLPPSEHQSINQPPSVNFELWPSAVPCTWSKKEFDIKVYTNITITKAPRQAKKIRIAGYTLQKYTKYSLSDDFQEKNKLAIPLPLNVKHSLPVHWISAWCLWKVIPHWWMKCHLVVLLPQQVCVFGACHRPHIDVVARVCLRAPGASASGMFPHRAERGTTRRGARGPNLPILHTDTAADTASLTAWLSSSFHTKKS